MTKLALLVLVVASCTRSAEGDDPGPQPPEPVRFEKPAMVRFHMQRHFDDLRQVERLLLAGKLDEAKTLATLLAKPASDPGMTRWVGEIEDVTSAARALSAAPGIDEALRREVRVAAACAICHARAQKMPVFPDATAAPADLATTAGRMARHQWAADRLWEGLVGASDRPWRAGLEALSTTPLPFTPATDAPALAHQLQDTAGKALARQRDGSESLDSRARDYGEMLVTCAACHASAARPLHRM